MASSSQRKLGMFDKGREKIFARLQSHEFLLDGDAEVSGIRWREIGQAGVFRVAPDAFIWIEFRCISGKWHCDNFAVLPKELANDPCPVVNVASVPKYGHWATQVTTELAKKVDYILCSYVLVVRHQLEVEPEPLLYGAQCNGTDCRNPISSIPAFLDRRLAPRRVCPSDKRCKHES